MTTSYVCIDLETTGLNPKLDKIIEIGAVKVIDGQITDTFHSYVNPGRTLEERIVELTGIEQGHNVKNQFASLIIDDRALGFTGDFKSILDKAKDFKPYWKE